MNLAFICMRGNNREYDNSYLYENAKIRRSLMKKGESPSTETRKKLSEAGKGRTPWNKGLTGKYAHNEETKKKMSEAHQGKKLSKETKEKLSEAMKGKNKGKKTFCGRKHTEETKNKMSESHKGKPGTNGFAGKKHTEDFKQRMRDDNPMHKKHKNDRTTRSK